MHPVAGVLLALLAACPDCPPAHEARAMFMELDLLHNALLAVAPFVVCLAVVIAIVRAAACRSRTGSCDAGE